MTQMVWKIVVDFCGPSGRGVHLSPQFVCSGNFCNVDASVPCKSEVQRFVKYGMLLVSLRRTKPV